MDTKLAMAGPTIPYPLVRKYVRGSININNTTPLVSSNLQYVDVAIICAFTPVPISIIFVIPRKKKTQVASRYAGFKWNVLTPFSKFIQISRKSAQAKISWLIDERW